MLEGHTLWEKKCFVTGLAIQFLNCIGHVFIRHEC